MPPATTNNPGEVEPRTVYENGSSGEEYARHRCLCFRFFFAGTFCCPIFRRVVDITFCDLLFLAAALKQETYGGVVDKMLYKLPNNSGSRFTDAIKFLGRCSARLLPLTKVDGPI